MAAGLGRGQPLTRDAFLFLAKRGRAAFHFGEAALPSRIAMAQTVVSNPVYRSDWKILFRRVDFAVILNQIP
jgi:hypothetical protein